MSITSLTTDYTDPSESGPIWKPVLTQKEALRAGISKDEYAQAFLYARMAAEEHQDLGTPRDRWETTLNQNDSLATPFITDGEQELAGRLETEADMDLDKSQDLVESVKANLDEIAEKTQPISSEETGASYSVAEAVERVEQCNKKIGRDEKASLHHHRRASRWFQRAATWAPLVESLGFLTFVTYYLNVPIFKPWEDWLGWSFAATVVLVIILGQTWLVRHAGRSHNHAREAFADGNRGEAEEGRKRRNRYIGLTAVTAVAITAGMIWRGTTALGNASLISTALMIFLAAVTGLLMPILIYLGVALDGSTVSRDRDGLVADLDVDLEEYLSNLDSSRRDLAEVTEISDRLTDKTFPDICNTTQETVDGVYGLYGTVRLLIGGLSAEPLAKTTKTLSQDADGSLHGYIGTSIPGTRRVNLEPLFDRWHRLTEIEKQRIALLARIEALPPHPWGRSRTD
jgi:hypothetical protein